MARRRGACSICGETRRVSPLYARFYAGHPRNGRYVRVAWACRPCFRNLAGLEGP